MIRGGTWRRAWIAILVALAVGIGFGQRSADAARADPPGAAARLQALADAEHAADAELRGLGVVLNRARGHARRGAALTVSGEAPAPELEAAADALAGGFDRADTARRALITLDGIAAAVTPAADVPALDYGTPELEQLAAQFRASAPAATLFVERRHAAREVVDALAGALAALDGDDPATALERLAQADAPLALLTAWEQRPPLFRYWMKVSSDLIEAARGIATATLDRDPAAVRAAADRYAEAAARARGADNALAVTLSEEGANVTEVPLQRLGAAADEVDDARAALAALLPTP